MGGRSLDYTTLPFNCKLWIRDLQDLLDLQDLHESDSNTVNCYVRASTKSASASVHCGVSKAS